MADRDVVVPLSVYKLIIFFSTLFAAVAVVGGFMALDVATNRARAPPAEIDPVLSIIGLGLIAGGAVIFAFAGRFRAPGMGTPKNDGNEANGNG